MITNLVPENSLCCFLDVASNALRVSRAASLPRSASSRAALHNQFCVDTRPRSGVGLHALVRCQKREVSTILRRIASHTTPPTRNSLPEMLQDLSSSVLLPAKAPVQATRCLRGRRSLPFARMF